MAETQHNVIMDGSVNDVEKFCLCQKPDSGVMIECIRATGGCNGWVHPSCCGLQHNEAELELMGDYICPLCDKKTNDYSKLGAVNTKLANERLQNDYKKKNVSIKAIEYNKDTMADEDIAEELSIEDFRRRSRRETRQKSYHVPASDEEIDSGGDQNSNKESKKQKSDKKRKKNREEMTKASIPYESTYDVYIPHQLSVDKIVGKRKTEVDVEGPTYNYKRAATEYLIKWKGFSHLHCSWELEETVINMDITNKQRIKRFEDKEAIKLSFAGDDDDDEYFSPDFTEVDRIIAERKVHVKEEDNEEGLDDGWRYLVKWRSLPYNESTWERNCDLNDDESIHAFHRIQNVPPIEQWEPLPRPSIREYTKLNESPNFGIDGTLKLREYQLEGLNWLNWNYYNERASILADEMGLGKTIQTLAFLDYLRTNPKIACRGPFLIVAPLSLIAQWQNESNTWTEMNCIVYHGNNDSRELMQQYEFYFPVSGTEHKPDKKKPFKFNILVTTFEVAMKDIRLLSRIHWRCLIVDEAHRLKNQKSRLVDNLSSLKRDHCVLLTGTPLQNKTEELWALLNFLDSKAFPNIHKFLEKFGDLQDSNQVAELHKMLKPFLLRRVKEDVEKSLPPKEETIVEVELTSIQKQWYRAIYERNTSILYRGLSAHNAPNLMNVMMELRKCCNHPYLNNGVEETVTINESLKTPEDHHNMLVKSSGKMVLLDKLLPRLKDDGHKVLIFSQMVRVLDIIEDYLRYLGYAYERLDGNIRGNLRQGAIDRFVNPEYNRLVMLLSTKAGGLGLNLTAADTVIIFDSDWNPQNDLQAQARAHRIGQTQSVKIYRLITRKTYEQHMFHRASLKLGLDQAVLTHMRQENEKESNKKKYSRAAKAEEAKEIEQLLKKGAYDVFREDDTLSEQFYSADIEQILQRSSQIVQYEQDARSTFSKASFVSAANDNDVDIDDPDFWKKAIGLVEPEVMPEEDFLIPAQRRRTRVARFGQEKEYPSEDENLKDEETEGEEDEDTSAQKSREWTINGRDRSQRALMQFGFGRWNVLRRQSGSSRLLEDVESFSRAFVFHCGLCCADSQGANNKEDSPFVKGAIRAAQAIQAEYFGNGTELPPILNETDFVNKLKQGGARRFLTRLDHLSRLHRMLRLACDAFKLKKEIEVELIKGKEMDEVDRCIDEYGVVEIANEIQIVDIGARPSWSKLTPWWDNEADRHLLIGIFFHGYGRYAQILSDPRLCFYRRAKEFEENKGMLKEEGHRKEEKELVLEESLSLNVKPLEIINKEINKNFGNDNACVDDMDVESVETNELEEEEEEDEAEHEKDELTRKSCTKEKVNEKETNSEKEDIKEKELNTFQQPEVQQMNRLFLWLISAEALKRQKDEEWYRKERHEQEKKRQILLDQQKKKACLVRTETKVVHLVQMDLLRQEALLHNQFYKRDVLTLKWSKRERRSICYLLASLGAPKVLTRQALLENNLSYPELTWEDMIEIGHLQKEPIQVVQFYEERYLPKCLAVASIRMDLLNVMDSKMNYAEDASTCDYVDVFESTSNHGLRARRVALLCLRRIRLLKAARYVLHHYKLKDIEFFLNDPNSCLNDTTNLPSWWIPSIHDIGFLKGVVKHGIFAIASIRKDKTLPLSYAAISEIIKNNQSLTIDNTTQQEDHEEIKQIDYKKEKGMEQGEKKEKNKINEGQIEMVDEEVNDKVEHEEEIEEKLNDDVEMGEDHEDEDEQKESENENQIKPQDTMWISSLLEKRLQILCAHFTKDLSKEDEQKIDIPMDFDIPPSDAVDSLICSLENEDSPFHALHPFDDSGLQNIVSEEEDNQKEQEIQSSSKEEILSTEPITSPSNKDEIEENINVDTIENDEDQSTT